MQRVAACVARRAERGELMCVLLRPAVWAAALAAVLVLVRAAREVGQGRCARVRGRPGPVRRARLTERVRMYAYA